MISPLANHRGTPENIPRRMRYAYIVFSVPTANSSQPFTTPIFHQHTRRRHLVLNFPSATSSARPARDEIHWHNLYFTSIDLVCLPRTRDGSVATTRKPVLTCLKPIFFPQQQLTLFNQLASSRTNPASKNSFRIFREVQILHRWCKYCVVVCKLVRLDSAT
jgi:hypothetical protein